MSEEFRMKIANNFIRRKIYSIEGGKWCVLGMKYYWEMKFI